MTLVAEDLSVEAAAPTGEADDWDDEILLALLLLFLSDAGRAVAMWDSLVPARFRGLLEAETFADVRAHVAAGGILPPIWFDVETQRYGLGSRGFITQAVLVGALEAFREGAQGQARQQTAGLFSGGDIGQWQRTLADDLRMIALAAALFAIGGTQRLQAMQGVLAQTSDALRFQMTRLLRFARQIEAGAVTAAGAVKRAAMYPDSVITDLYHETRRRAHSAVGFKVERNILDPDAEHCLPKPGDPTPDCPGVTSQGWVKINTLPRIGDRRCKWNCRCRWEFSRIPNP